MVLLMERAKLYVEGAGAVGVAALMSGAVAPRRRGTTCVVLSGGNVDLGVVPGLIRRHETQAGRRLTVFVRIDDRPGGLARLLAIFAGIGANLLEVQHVREGVDLHVRETGVRASFEVRAATTRRRDRRRPRGRLRPARRTLRPDSNPFGTSDQRARTAATRSRRPGGRAPKPQAASAEASEQPNVANRCGRPGGRAPKPAEAASTEASGANPNVANEPEMTCSRTNAALPEAVLGARLARSSTAPRSRYGHG